MLVNPGFAVDTAAVYQQYDRQPVNVEAGAAEAMLQALQQGSPAAIRASLYNALEAPAFKLFPQLAAIKAELQALGLAALLCGSGATVLGIAADKKRAAIAAEALYGKYPFVQAVTTRNPSAQN